MIKNKIVHGHFSEKLKEESDRIIEYCKKMYNINITFTEATALAAERSQSVFWSDKKLKDSLSRMRGL